MGRETSVEILKTTKAKTEDDYSSNLCVKKKKTKIGTKKQRVKPFCYY